jgi:V/A-type H+-transporting ATPase subunit C
MASNSYPFAVGRITGLSAHLLDEKMWNRLIEANEKDALRILIESGYGTNAKEKTQIEALVDAELSDAYQVAKEIAPEPELINLFLLPEDAHNLKILLKGLHQRMDTKNLLHPGGSIPIEQLLNAFEANGGSDLPSPIEETIAALMDEEDPMMISAGVDRAIFAHIQDVLASQKKNYALVRNYFALKIDCNNMLAIVRGNALKWDARKVQKMMIQSDTLNLETLLAAVGLSNDQLSKVLARGHHRDALRKMFDQYAQNADIGQLEQAMDQLTFSVIKESRNDSFGIGPIVYYLLRRENEAKALRVLFAQKRAGMLSSMVGLGIAG